MKALILPLLLLAAPLRAELTKEAAQSLDEGLHHLYTLDYAQSRAAFRGLIEREPDNPFGYLFEAGAIWWQSSMEYGLFKDTPTLQGLFEQDVEAAIRKADAWTDSKDPAQKADGHFVLGMALGTKGQWEVMRGHYVKAYFDGKKAIKHLKKCLKLDETYYDAELGLGVFDYQAAQMSGILRLSAIVGGVRGDEKRGLEKIAVAVEKGRYGSRQATELLMFVYLHDKKDYAKALPLIRKLRQGFPESPFFTVLEAAALDRLGDKEGSFAAGRDTLLLALADPAAFNRKLLSLTCGADPDHCLAPFMREGLRHWFTAAVEREEAALVAARKLPKTSKPRPGPTVAEREKVLQLLRLYRGYVHDLSEHPEAADADYKKVLAGPDVGDAKARAKECLATRCGEQNLFAYMRALSKGEAWIAPEKPSIP